MMDENIVLCGASAYEEKFYLNEAFSALPDGIKDELKVISVLFTQDVGGVLTMDFDANGNLNLHTQSQEDDFGYDEIGSVLKIKELQREKEELFEALETFYRVLYMGEEYET